MIPATILVIAKEPIAGRVKTRLCPPCTPVEAADVAAAALSDTLETLNTIAVRRRVLVLEGQAGPWLPGSFEVVPQVSGGLATRLAAALAAVDGPSLLVGMDTPQLNAGLVLHALRTLLQRGTDAVIGPADDGGWWAIGFRRSHPCAFDGVPMSTQNTGAHQKRQLRALGLRTRCLPVLRDVDCFDDARAVAATIPMSRFAAVVAATSRTVGSRASTPREVSA
jgi:glycosyltransferase A (GT-A) superfamily protein (DUF2064 family)